MADTSGQNDIRGINIDKLAKGFADEEIIFKKFLTNASTSARLIRWFQKTAGFLDSVDTSGITASQGANVSHLALPDVIEQSWTRNESTARKYIFESPWISFEDIRDSDVTVLATNVRDVTRAVAKQVDVRIFDVLTESQSPSNINSHVATGGGGWDAASGANPILDLISGSMAIRSNSYDVSNLVVIMPPAEYKHLLDYIISTAGSNIPAFASREAETGVLTRVVGQRIVVSNNVVADNVVQFVPNRAATWYTFMPITAQTKEEVGIGVKIRVWEEGEAVLTDPSAVNLITNTSA